MQLRARYSVLLLPLAACLLQSPQYEGTEFSCAQTGSECPTGYECVEQVCRPSGSPTDRPGVDAGATPVPDAATLTPDAQTTAPDAAPATSVTVVVLGSATHDTYIREDIPEELSGERHSIRVDADPRKIGLLRFDLSSIPTTAVIESAELVVSATEGLESGELVGHRLLQDWSEHEASWYERKLGVPWTSPGAGTGSYDPAPLLSITPRDLGSYVVPIPTNVAQTWVSIPDQNFGVRLTSTSADGRGVALDSSDSSSGEGPQLRVRYH